MSEKELQRTKDKIKELKLKNGSHSPSINTILNVVQKDLVQVDACFLSNPYATELFSNYLEERLLNDKAKWKRTLEFYPPQNNEVAQKIEKVLQISHENIFVGNGAIEIIQALLHNYVFGKLCVILPTFSPNYEFINGKTEVVYYHLKKENNFEFDAHHFIHFCKENEINNIVLVNPNNPNGNYISNQEITLILEELSDIDNIILDESFIHFAYEDLRLSEVSLAKHVLKYPNLSVIKSMSKDFGIAGIRCGYGVLSKRVVSNLLKNGYLWNISGLANFFFTLYSDDEFQREYDSVRKKYIMNTLMFINELKKLETQNTIKVYPSKANFVLIELLNGLSSVDCMLDLLVDDGVYIRECSDKKGLNDGDFIRVASRNFEDNLLMIEAFKRKFKI